jgi:hypothetical protein
MIKWKHLNRHQVKHLLRFHHQQKDKHQHNKIKKRVSNNSARLARARGWFSNAKAVMARINLGTPPVINRIESSNCIQNNYH